MLNFTISEWMDNINSWARSKGWRFNGQSLDDGQSAKECLNVISEIVEAWEEIRNNHAATEIYYSTDTQGQQKPEGVPVEMADAVIRIFDFCYARGIDLPGVMQAKMDYNAKRPYRHGGKSA